MGLKNSKLKNELYIDISTQNERVNEILIFQLLLQFQVTR